MPEEQDNLQVTQSNPSSSPGAVISPEGQSLVHGQTVDIRQAAPSEPLNSNAPKSTVAQEAQLPPSAEQEDTRFDNQMFEPGINAPVDKNIDEFSWTASEFVAHQKSAGWYGLLAISAALLAVALYIITRDIVSSGFVIFGSIVFGYYAARQPKDQAYRLSNKGIDIGNKHFNYESFRSFSIIEEGNSLSIVLMPLKRFAPLRAMYFDPKQEDQIASILTLRLPFEERTHDAVDRLMNRIRF